MVGAAVIGFIIYKQVSKSTGGFTPGGTAGLDIKDAKGNVIGKTDGFGNIVNSAGGIIAKVGDAGDLLNKAGDVIGQLTGDGGHIAPAGAGGISAWFEANKNKLIELIKSKTWEDVYAFVADQAKTVYSWYSQYR